MSTSQQNVSQLMATFQTVLCMHYKGCKHTVRIYSLNILFHAKYKKAKTIINGHLVI